MKKTVLVTAQTIISTSRNLTLALTKCRVSQISRSNVFINAVNDLGLKTRGFQPQNCSLKVDQTQVEIPTLLVSVEVPTSGCEASPLR